MVLELKALTAYSSPSRSGAETGMSCEPLKPRSSQFEYKLREIIFQSGERFAFLLQPDGTPVDEVMLYTTIHVRNRHKAYKTFLSYLRAISFLYLWAHRQNLDLKAAVEAGDELDLNRIDSFCRAAMMPLRTLAEEEQRTATGVTYIERLSSNLESVRPRRAVKVQPAVSAHHTMVRLHVARDFLGWWTQQELSRRMHDTERHNTYREWRDMVLSGLNARMPRIHRSSLRGDAREGLDDAQKKALVTCIVPGAPTNPFASAFTQKRNHLIVQLLLTTGMRASELLNLKTTDVNLQSRTLQILRRPDDPEDSRRREPNVKTRGRELELMPDMVDLLLDYITQARNKHKRARKHDFLVISDEGEPLSLSALELVFRTLRSKVEGIPSTLSSHVLRHTWNDAFSALMSRQKVAAAREAQLRSYFMGWKPTSGTAMSYTRRFTREKATEISMLMQEALCQPGE